MAISIDWASKVISVPQSFLTLISGARYRLDIEVFRHALREIEASEAGAAKRDTHRRKAPVTLSGVIYAQTFEIINGYTVTFEDTGTPYRVECTGANHNIADVQNVNNVSLLIGNSAGLIVVETGVSGLTPSESALLNGIADVPGAMLAAMNTTPPDVNVKTMNDATVIGTGAENDRWRGVGVSP